MGRSSNEKASRHLLIDLSFSAVRNYSKCFQTDKHPIMPEENMSIKRKTLIVTSILFM